MTALLYLIATRWVLHVGLFRWAQRRFGCSRAEAWMAALLGAQVLQLALAHGLSFGHDLRPALYAPLYGVLAAAVWIFAQRTSFASPPPASPWIPTTKLGKIFGLSLVAVATLVAYRAIFFFDTTYDVLTYGLTKLGGYVQHASVFHLTGLSDLRVDANERNGELLFLHYFLTGGDLRWLALGGVEVWITLASAIGFLARRAGADATWSLGAMALIASCPLAFGLSGVTKGDALASAWMVAAAGWLVGSASTHGQVFCWLALAQAVNCKVSAAFPGLALAAIQVWRWRHARPKVTLGVGALGLAAVAVLFAKPIHNLLVYGQPFVRTPHESDLAGFSVHNLLDALIHFTAPILGFQADLLPVGYHSDLGKSLGLVSVMGIIVGVASLIALRRSDETGNARGSGTGAVVLGPLIGTIVMLSIMPTYDPVLDLHSLRFATPTLLILATLALVSHRSQSGLWWGRVLPILFLAGTSWHWLVNTTASPSFSHFGRSDLITRAWNYDRPSARFGYWFKDEPDRKLLAAMQREPRTVQVTQLEGDAPISWAFGDNFQWQVVALKSAPTAASALREVHPAADILVVVTKTRPPLHADPANDPSSPGWRRVVDLSLIDVYERAQ